jgi:putative glutamine transport system permease protein
VSGPFSLHNWQTWFSDWTFFAGGFLRTLYISLLGLLFTLIIGLIVGILLCGKHRVVLAICRGYMSFFQNTPLVIQVFIYYNVLPKLGIRLGVVAIGVLGLALYTAPTPPTSCTAPSRPCPSARWRRPTARASTTCSPWSISSCRKP